jgi:hypothetical protein
MAEMPPGECFSSVRVEMRASASLYRPRLMKICARRATREEWSEEAVAEVEEPRDSCLISLSRDSSQAERSPDRELIAERIKMLFGVTP